MESKARRSFAADRAAGLTSIPADALRFDAVPFQLAADDEAEDGQFPISMLARSAEPIEHWYWGKVVHDMAGMSLAAQTLPIDYCHDDGQVLGVLDTFNTSDKGLEVGGKLISFQPTDRTAEVVHKAKAGIPYQSSIYFDPHAYVAEHVPENHQVTVNGGQLQGPGLVLRKWMLRGVAVCPYGYDHRTSTKLSADVAEDVPLKLLNPTEVSSMKPATEKKPEEKPATELSEKKNDNTPATPVDPRAEFKATLAKFTEKFGAANGAKWAAEGLTYEAALEKHVAELSAQVTAEQGEKKQLAEKLAAIPRGEKEPVTFADGDKREGTGNVDPSHLKFKIGENLAKVAAGIKLPSKK